MTNSTISTSESYFPIKQQQHNHSMQYRLKWRQGQLLVSLSGQVKQLYLSGLESKQGLVECLKHSSVRLVRVDSGLGESKLKFWADACEQAGKTMFLKLPAAHELHKQKAGVIGWWQRLIEWIIAALLLLALSPFMLSLAWLIVSQSPGSVFSPQWCVGKRGKLFRVLRFRTMVEAEKPHPQVIANQGGVNLHKYENESYVTPLGQWMRKYQLHKLPQLFDVLRGEISLMAFPRTLSDALCGGSEANYQSRSLNTHGFQNSHSSSSSIKGYEVLAGKPSNTERV